MKLDLGCLMVAVEYTQFVRRETFQCRFFSNSRLSHHRKFGLAQTTHEADGSVMRSRNHRLIYRAVCNLRYAITNPAAIPTPSAIFATRSLR